MNINIILAGFIKYMVKIRILLTLQWWCINHPLDLEGYTEAENEGMEKIFHATGTKRKQYLHLYQTKFRP